MIQFDRNAQAEMRVSVIHSLFNHFAYPWNLLFSFLSYDLF